ncbi:unnamed protein product [Hermetia illucens]|uniref:Nucleic-acid-binding protein from transposon X-element n=1 Tax=Hermetia illucens TaxID=343691 RepID=A0A7R8YVW2_HERIL|nr:unnamed protein product [Hermetia illucens]
MCLEIDIQEEEGDEFNFVQRRKKKSKEKISISNAPQAPSLPPPSYPHKKAKITPITGYKINVPQFLRILKEKMLKATLKSTKADRNLIFAQSLENHPAIFNLIKEKGLHATTSTPPPLRTQSLVIRGLHRKTDIIRELNEEYPHLKVKSVSNLVTQADKLLHSQNPTLPLKSQSGLFMATFEPEQELNEAFKVKYILHQKISLEKVKKCSATTVKTSGKSPSIAPSCTGGVRCMKTHVPGKCPSPIADKPTCSNCGQSGYPANYRGCPAYKDMIARREAGRAKKMPKP